MTIASAIQKIALARVARLRYAFAPAHEFRPASPKYFSHLDLSYYTDIQTRLERLGFALLCDLEPIDFNRQHPEWRTFERYTRTEDGNIVAASFQLHASGQAKAKLLQPSTRPGVAELSTELTDGSDLCTHNSRTTANVVSPPNHFAFRMRGEPVEDLFTSHCGRLEWLLSQRPTAQILSIRTQEDLLAALNRAQARRHAFFKSAEFDLGHYTNILGRRYTRAVNRAIADAVRKLLADEVAPSSETPWLEDPD